MISMKRNDLLPSFTSTLEAPAGVPIDLTGCTVKLIMTPIGSTTPKVNAAATIVTPTSGAVRYDWVGTDTDTIGAFKALWEITYPSGKKRSVPSIGYQRVVIEDDLG